MTTTTDAKVLTGKTYSARRIHLATCTKAQAMATVRPVTENTEDYPMADCCKGK
jgi:hypothetical protein